MKRLMLSVVGLLLLGSAVSGQDNLPIAATVRIEKIESKQADHERRIAELERLNAELRASNKSAIGEPASTPKAVETIGWRNPVGHTHTCPNCGDTWDHAKNPTHQCQRCGTSQYVQDAVPRMVQVRTTDSVRPVASQPVASQAYTYSFGGCPNGQCDTAGYRRGSLFRRW